MKGALHFTIAPYRGGLSVARVTGMRSWRWSGTFVEDGVPLRVHPADCIGQFPTLDLALRALEAVRAVNNHYRTPLATARAELAAMESARQRKIAAAVAAATPKWENAA
jgi:hypothetical protein